jgi:hypothetical protein
MFLFVFAKLSFDHSHTTDSVGVISFIFVDISLSSNLSMLIGALE